MINFLTYLLVALTMFLITDMKFNRPFQWKKNIVAAVVIAFFVWLIFY